MYDNLIKSSKNGSQERCWRCGRLLYQYVKNPNRMGCLNSRCSGYLFGAKRIDPKFLVPFKR